VNNEVLKKLSFQTPHAKHKNAFLIALDSVAEAERLAWVYMGDNADVNFPKQDFKTYVDNLLQRETNPPPNFVCDTVYWAFVDDQMVGRISIRHELNEFLQKVGGHIGYIVHPKWRKQGIATWMLSEMLKTKRAKMIGRLLLTCDENNAASEKTILKNGGVFDRLVAFDPAKPKKKHFWINLK
jgi:predicted acetyltransferase